MDSVFVSICLQAHGQHHVEEVLFALDGTMMAGEMPVLSSILTVSAGA